MISFIYFDVGGVAMLDFSGTNKWELLKKEMGVNKTNSVTWENVWSLYKNEVCVNKDVDTLLPLFQEAGFDLPKDYSMLESFINLFEKNESIWSVMESAKSKYRVGLLTNMYPRLLDELFFRKLIPPKEWWEIIVDSSEVGLQKPDKKIFEIAQQRADAKVEEILFVENTSEHLQAAKDAGWQTFAYNSTLPKESSKKLMELLGSSNL